MPACIRCAAIDGAQVYNQTPGLWGTAYAMRSAEDSQERSPPPKAYAAAVKYFSSSWKRWQAISQPYRCAGLRPSAAPRQQESRSGSRIYALCPRRRRECRREPRSGEHVDSFPLRGSGALPHWPGAHRKKEMAWAESYIATAHAIRRRAGREAALGLRAGGAVSA